MGKQAEAEPEIKLSQQIRTQQASQNNNDDAAQAAMAKIPGLEANRRDLGRQNLEAALKPGKKTAAEEAAVAQYRQQVAGILGDSYNNLGVIHAQRQEYAQAANLFEQAARWDAKIPALDKNWALASFRANAYTQAISASAHSNAR